MVKTAETRTEDKLELIPVLMRGRFNDKQIRTVRGYATEVKLRGVLKWKPRMAAAGISVKMLAEKLEMVSFRISEYLNFTHEPSEEKYLDIERAIYELESQE